MSAKDVLTYAKERKAEFVDMKFIDFPGVWQHITYPIKQLEVDSFTNGYGFDTRLNCSSLTPKSVICCSGVRKGLSFGIS